uniref:protein C10-like n=1 Tax=Styela clava TaxID=7725 RepID=UPI00193A9FF6|nr:protein C10-like [Styela clava]
MTSAVPLQEIKNILLEIIHELGREDNAIVLNQFTDRRDNDAVALAQNVFPFIAKIEQDVIGRHGFTPNERGLLEFVHCVRFYEDQNEEIARMHSRIRSYYLPPMKF